MIAATTMMVLKPSRKPGRPPPPRLGHSPAPRRWPAARPEALPHPGLGGAGRHRPRRHQQRRARPITCDWKIAPSPAMPVAIPTWRNVLLIPEAVPLRRWSTTLTAVAERRVHEAHPVPAMTNPASRVVHFESGETPPMRSSPVPTAASPRRSVPAPAPGHEPAASGAAKKDSTDTGRNRSPAGTASTSARSACRA